MMWLWWTGPNLRSLAWCPHSACLEPYKLNGGKTNWEICNYLCENQWSGQKMCCARLTPASFWMEQSEKTEEQIPFMSPPLQMVVTTQGQRLPHRGTPWEFPWEPELSASMILFLVSFPQTNHVPRQASKPLRQTAKLTRQECYAQVSSDWMEFSSSVRLWFAL